MVDAWMALGMSNDDTHTAYLVNIGRGDILGERQDGCLGMMEQLVA